MMLDPHLGHGLAGNLEVEAGLQVEAFDAVGQALLKLSGHLDDLADVELFRDDLQVDGAEDAHPSVTAEAVVVGLELYALDDLTVRGGGSQKGEE